MPMHTLTDATADILKNRNQGERESTYAMLMQLVATNQAPECLRALEKMASSRIGCWRDVRGFIRHFEQHGDPADAVAATAIIHGCVRMTNAQLRKDCENGTNASLAAKWVPREPRCRGSPLLEWYYEALAADMFPGARAPDAKRRFRQLVSSLSSQSPSSPPTLTWLVKAAERAPPGQPERAQHVNAMWEEHLRRHGHPRPCHRPCPRPCPRPIHLIPALSLAHSMGPGCNHCLHAGIGLALHAGHMASCDRILAFSSHAEWHVLEGDFVSQVQQLLRAARSPTNGLNANLENALAAAADKTLLVLVISDMEHDAPVNAEIMTWNVSRNGRPADMRGDNLDFFREINNRAII